MPKFEAVIGEVSGRNRFSIKGNTKILIIRLHFFDGEFSTSSVEISEDEEKVILKASQEVLDRIKGFLVKRDSLVDVAWGVLQNEYRTLDKIEDKVERLQNASIHTYSQEILENVVRVKKNLFSMHRDYIHLRNIVETAIDENYERRNMQKILRDVNEMIEVVEYLVDVSTTTIQLMQNTLSAKMNEVMKLLTIIATIMMPLTLITGIYGMNFRNMPELKWEYGYFFTLGVMAAIALLMLYYFKRKRML